VTERAKELGLPDGAQSAVLITNFISVLLLSLGLASASSHVSAAGSPLLEAGGAVLQAKTTRIKLLPAQAGAAAAARLQDCRSATIVFSGLRSRAAPGVVFRVYAGDAAGFVGELNFFGTNRYKRGGAKVSFMVDETLQTLRSKQTLRLPLVLTLESSAPPAPNSDPSFSHVALWCGAGT